MLKKLKPLSFLLAGVVAFSSCSDDDDSGNGTTGGFSLEDQLVGNWTVSEIEASGTLEIAGQNILFNAEATSITNSYYQVEISPQQYVSRVEAVLEVTTIAGSNDVPYGPFEDSGAWRVVGSDSLYVDQNGQEVGYEIISLSSTKLRLATEQEINFAGQDIESEVELVLTK